MKAKHGNYGIYNINEKRQQIMKRRILTALLTISIILGTLLSCSQSEASKDPKVQVIPIDTPADNTETTDIFYDMPEISNIDMHGEDFNIFVMQHFVYQPLDIVDVGNHEITGESFNDAAYERNNMIEEKFKCNVNTIIRDGNPNSLKQEVVKTVQSGEDVYDICFMRGNQYNSLLGSGVMRDISETDTINLSAEWWDNDAYEAFGIKNKHYAVISDMTMNSYLEISSIFYNKTMGRNFNIESPYQVVAEGRWTIDKLYEISRIVSADLDNNEVLDNQDRYGFTYVGGSTESLTNGMGVKLVKKDHEGIPYMSVSENDGYSKIQRLTEILSDTTASYNCHARSIDANKDESGIFINGQALCLVGFLYYASLMRTMNDDFGIIPYPKYNEEQESYAIPVIGGCLTFCMVPITNEALDETGSVMEYMAYLGRKLVYPAFFESLLVRKVARDNESAETLNMIFKERFYDEGMLFNYGGIQETTRIICTEFKNVASIYESRKEMVNKAIEMLFVDSE